MLPAHSVQLPRRRAGCTECARQTHVLCPGISSSTTPRLHLRWIVAVSALAFESRYTVDDRFPNRTYHGRGRRERQRVGCKRALCTSQREAAKSMLTNRSHCSSQHAACFCQTQSAVALAAQQDGWLGREGRQPQSSGRASGAAGRSGSTWPHCTHPPLQCHSCWRSCIPDPRSIPRCVQGTSFQMSRRLLDSDKRAGRAAATSGMERNLGDGKGT